MMLNFLRQRFITLSAAAILSFVPLAVPAVAHAQDQIQGGLKCGSNLQTEGTDCAVDAGTTRVNDLITRAVNIFSIIVGIIAVIMIIVGGFKYITSGGDSGNITSAKNTIVYAVIGLVIVALAQFLVQFVLDKATS